MGKHSSRSAREWAHVLLRKHTSGGALLPVQQSFCKEVLGLDVLPARGSSRLDATKKPARHDAGIPANNMPSKPHFVEGSAEVEIDF